MEGGVDKALDKGGVVRGRGNAELAGSRRGDADGYFVFLWTIHEDDVDSSGVIVR